MKRREMRHKPVEESKQMLTLFQKNGKLKLFAISVRVWFP